MQDQTEIYEVHVMPELSVIFHVDTVKNWRRATPNWHENIELLFFREGEAQVLCNSEMLHVAPGDICVFSANYVHGVSADNALYDCLIIDRNLCLEAGVDTADLVFPARIRDAELVRLYRAVAAEVQSTERAYRVAAVRGCVLSLLAYLCRRYAARNKEGESRAAAGVRTVLRYIGEHLSEGLTVDELATVAGFSKYHFLREFKRYTSYTVISYLNLVRIERAKSLLLRGTPVGEAALATGFDNLSYFSKVFRKHTGLSPSAYLTVHSKK